MGNSEVITFIDQRVPGLRSGTYTVTVDTQVQVPNADPEDYTVTRRFQVAGTRFNVAAGDIHAVFPPPKASGPYAGCLPHVVFNRAMLPWLRSLGESASSAAPWLAVLLFGASQAPALQTLKIRDLVASGVDITEQNADGDNDGGTGSLPSGYLSYPFDPPWDQAKCRLEYGETADDGILAIDIPSDLFTTIAPSASDMDWLAHVREVDVKADRAASTSKGGAPSDDSLDTGQFATVMGNRMAQPGAAIAMLVSLEGMADRLPGGSNSDLAGISHVRLAVLHTWNFDTQDVNDSVLLYALEHLCDAPHGAGLISDLRIPAPLPAGVDVAQALTAQQTGTLSAAQASVLVRHALAMGYIPLAHQMRTGGQDISWYRGPLTPVAVTAPITVPLDSMDAALAYNPETGLFDVSYAAAWQLGQLLALSNRQFSSALYAWQRRVAEEAAAKQDDLSTYIASLMAVAGQTGGETAVGGASAATATTAKAAKAATAATVATATTAETVAIAAPESAAIKQDSGDIPALLARIIGTRFEGPDGRGQSRTDPQTPPAEVTAWLDDLRQLKHVPLRYLIASDLLLTNESLRFFYLDTNWVNAMLDGACSVARSVAPGGVISTTSWFYPETALGAITGFVLNSALVLNWPGLRIAAYQGDAKLTPIYDDTPTKGMRLMLYDGTVDRLEIREGGEGLHFGVEAIVDSNEEIQGYCVDLRYLSGTVGALINNGNGAAQLAGRRSIRLVGTTKGWTRETNAGDAEPATAPVTFRDASTGVIDIDATAAAIQGALHKLGQLDENAHYTSAEFALEMVKSVAHVSYQWYAADIIPNIASTHAPAFAAYQGLLYVIYKGADNNQLYYTYFDGKKWATDPGSLVIPGVEMGATGSAPPAAVVYDGKLYVFYTATANDYICYTYFDGKNWAADASSLIVPDAAEMDNTTAPAVAVYNGYLYIAYKGGGWTMDPDSMYYDYFDGTNWNKNPFLLNVPDVVATTSPALAIYDSKLFLTYKGPPGKSQNSFYCKHFDGSTWSAEQLLTDGGANGLEVISSASTICAANGSLQVAYVSRDPGTGVENPYNIAVFDASQILDSATKSKPQPETTIGYPPLLGQPQGPPALLSTADLPFIPAISGQKSPSYVLGYTDSNFKIHYVWM